MIKMECGICQIPCEGGWQIHPGHGLEGDLIPLCPAHGADMESATRDQRTVWVRAYVDLPECVLGLRPQDVTPELVEIYLGS